MVYAIAAKSGQRPRWHQLEHAIKRNFGGLVEGEPVKIFKRYFQDTDVSIPSFLKKIMNVSESRDNGCCFELHLYKACVKGLNA